MSAPKSSGPPAGYVFSQEDGLWRKGLEFPVTGHGSPREVLVRDHRGRLVRVERGAQARRFFLCAT